MPRSSRFVGWRRSSGPALATLLVATAVGCSNDDSSVESTVATTVATSAPSTTTTTLPPTPMFGDAPSPCGTAVGTDPVTIAEGQNSSDTLLLGVPHDSEETSSSPRSDTLDAARAFAQWCNDQGGIRGLTIDIVDLDGRTNGVPLAMELACPQVFALVGGGWSADDQMFPRFHECGLVSFPAYTSSAAATSSNGRVQALPTPIDVDTSMWLDWIESTYSSAVDNIAIVHADRSATTYAAARTAALMEIVGGFGEPVLVPFDATDSPDWSAIVRDLVAQGIESVSFIGSATHLTSLVNEMNRAGFAPAVVFGDSSLMVDTVLENLPPQSPIDLRIRAIHDPSADDAAGTSLDELLASIEPAAAMSGLGILTTSSMLLFATAANTCLDGNGNVLERECVLARALEIEVWTAGGLHAATNPAEDLPAPCVLVVGAVDGAWTRIHPVPDSSDGDASNWDCDTESLVTIEGDFGDASVGIDSTRLN